MNVFEAVKQSVTTRQAAEHYGIHVGRNGMACCPFHHDKTPSMKLDRRYHCFGCGADGDVIDFAAALYGLGKKDAAVQLAQDFGLSYEDWKPPGKAKKPKPRQKSPEEQFQEAKSRPRSSPSRKSCRIRQTRKKHKEPPRHRRNTDNRIWNFNRHLPFSIRECQVFFSFFKEG